MVASNVTENLSVFHPCKYEPVLHMSRHQNSLRRMTLVHPYLVARAAGPSYGP